MFGSRRDLFHFEAPEDGGGAPAEAVEPIEQLEPAASAEERDAWAGVSRDEWERTQQFVQAAGPFLQNLALQQQQQQYEQQQQQQQQQLPEWDPFDPEVVAAHVTARVQSGIEQALGPYTPLLGQVAQETSMRQAEQELGKLESSVGTFDRDAALLIAAPMIDAGQQPDTSLRAAAQYMHDLEQRIRADERKVVQAEFQQLREAGQQQGPGRTPGVTATEFDQVPTGPDRYHKAIERALARRNGGFPVG